MSKSYTSLKSALITKVDALTGQDGNSLFVDTYGVAETEPDGFPCAFVLERVGRGDILDTHRNEREWQFDIIIQVKISDSRTPESAYDALLDAVDRVIESFDQDPTLEDSNGQAQCKYARVMPVEFEFGTADVAYHNAVLTVAIVDIVNRYSP